jgi:C-terminal processing protease CtpA/Prc
MKKKVIIALLVCLMIFTTVACSKPESASDQNEGNKTDLSETTPILAPPAATGEVDPNEPVLITGTIPFTSPFFLDGNAEPFVLLEDQAGFAARDKDFEFPLAGQAIGPVDLIEDNLLGFSLPLPTIPQGTLLDVDNNGQTDEGVMVFAVAYWSNTWGGPFLEERDGTGWSSAYATTITDSDRDYEITGGYLIIWAPDENQSFPSGFGDDNMLFTEDDPVQTVPAGYSIVNLNQTPFEITKEAQPEFELVEGEGALKDYSDLTYSEAFETMFEKVAIEYPFTKDKNIDWDALHDEFSPLFDKVRNDTDFYRLMKDFTLRIPDSHVGMSFNAEVFFEDQGGSFGLVLQQLSDKRVLITDVVPNSPADLAGIEIGAEILTWNALPVDDALAQIEPWLGPYSTEHSKRMGQLIGLTRVPPYESVQISYQNPGQGTQTIDLDSDIEYESLFIALGYYDMDELELPVEGEILDNYGLGYIKINTFSDDYNLMARLWDRYIKILIDNDIPGLIIDMRSNSGGNGGLAMDFAGYLFDQNYTIAQHAYYNEVSGQFEYTEYPSEIETGPMYYDGYVVVLVSPDCVSACEGFTNALTTAERSIVVGHYPTNGAFGEVGRGQYELPGEISIQFPTGRPETMDGDLLIEGIGVVPAVTVPVTAESVFGQSDPVLDTAIQTLLDLIY